MSYSISPPLSELVHSRWRSPGPLMPQAALFHFFHGWRISHCMYVQHLLCPSHRQGKGQHVRLLKSVSSPRGTPLTLLVGGSCKMLERSMEHQLSYIWEVRNQACPTLCNPVNCSPPVSSVHGTLQASILEWVAISFSRGFFWPRDLTHVSWIGRWILYCWATRKARLMRFRILVILCIFVILYSDFPVEFKKQSR